MRVKVVFGPIKRKELQKTIIPSFQIVMKPCKWKFPPFFSNGFLPHCVFDFNGQCWSSGFLLGYEYMGYVCVCMLRSGQPKRSLNQMSPSYDSWLTQVLKSAFQPTRSFCSVLSDAVQLATKFYSTQS